MTKPSKSSPASIRNSCFTLYLVRIMVSRSHQGDVMKMAEKFKPPGVVTPAGGSGYKVISCLLIIAANKHSLLYIH